MIYIFKVVKYNLEFDEDELKVFGRVVKLLEEKNFYVYTQQSDNDMKDMKKQVIIKNYKNGLEFDNK